MVRSGFEKIIKIGIKIQEVNIWIEDNLYYLKLCFRLAKINIRLKK